MVLRNRRSENTRTNHPVIDLWNRSHPEWLWPALLRDLVYPGNAMIGIDPKSKLLRWYPHQLWSMHADGRSELRIHWNLGGLPQPKEWRYLINRLGPDGVSGIGPLSGALTLEMELDRQAIHATNRALRQPDFRFAISPPEDVSNSLNEKDLEKLNGYFELIYSNPDVFLPLMYNKALNIQTFAKVADRADFGFIRRTPQTALLAALGVSPSVIQIEAGVDATRTGTPYEQQRIESYNSAVRPNQVLLARQLSHWLLPLFKEDTNLWELDFDNSDNPIVMADRRAQELAEEQMLALRWQRISAIPDEIMSVDEKRKALLLPDKV